MTAFRIPEQLNTERESGEEVHGGECAEVEELVFQTVIRMFSVHCMLTNAGAPIEQVGAIVMETTSAFTVVPARQVDTAGVVVALNQALCTLVDI